MNTAEREPMEQIDYGINYKAQNSPQQSLNLKVEGGTLAIALALVALGAVLAAIIILPQLAESRANEAVAVALRPISAQVASAQDRAWLAERTGNINAEHLNEVRFALEAKGIHITLNDHK